LSRLLFTSNLVSPHRRRFLRRRRRREDQHVCMLTA